MPEARLIQLYLLATFLSLARKLASWIPASGQNQAQKPLPKNKADRKRAPNTIKLPDIMPSDAPMIIGHRKQFQKCNCKTR